MSWLVDTHVVLWWLGGDRRLGEEVKRVLDHEPDVHLSAASVWEVAVKQAIGKLEGPPDLPELMTSTGLRLLDITARHAAAAGRLPLLHRDPFDRILIAQARTEGLTLVTADAHVHRYDVAVREPS